MAWNEQLLKRRRTSITFQNSDNPLQKQLYATMAPLFYEGTLDSGVFDTPIDTTIQRIQNAQLDGWMVTANDWHYALGQPAGKSDGWVGFGGRQGQNWFQFRLLRVGYLHGPTRTWYDIGGTPNYNRNNLSQSAQSITLGPNSDTFSVEASAIWTSLWTTPAGGNVSVRWRVNGDQLKEDITINAAARTWITNNRPPSYFGIPASEAYFGFVFQVDWSDIPQVLRQGVVQNLQDFADDGIPIELRDAQNRLLAFMPLDKVKVVSGGIEYQQSLRKRFYRDTDDYLALGLLATDLASLPAGDLLFDPSINPSVGASTDDARLSDTGYNDSETNMQVGGTGTTTTNFGQGFRFTNITIAKGSVVDTASISLKKYQNQWSNVDFRLTCIDEDNTATFSSGSPPGARAITSSYIAAETDGTNKTNGTRYTYPTTSPLQQTLGNAVETVINRSGWNSGQALAIVDNSDQDALANTGYGRDTYYTYDNGAGDAPQLTVNYTEPAPVYDQEGFRFRNDNEDENSATWRQDQDVDDTIAKDTILRLRVIVNATNNPASQNYQLEYKRSADAASEWRKVP